MKHLTPAPDWLTSVPIAHRGYHDIGRGRAENSAGAFSAAVDAGFAIECDVQITNSGEPVVFHDPALKRMTGIDGNVCNFSPSQLAPLRLLKTTDGIYTLKQHLDIVAGNVPLVIELKGGRGKATGLVEGVAESLDAYDGPVCVMSFDHWVCAQFARLLPDIPHGLTAKGGEETDRIHHLAMTEYDLNFISYGVTDLPNGFVQQARDAGIPVISWTIRDNKTRALAAAYSDQMTFEGFDPRSPFDD